MIFKYLIYDLVFLLILLLVIGIFRNQIMSVIIAGLPVYLALFILFKMFR